MTIKLIYLISPPPPTQKKKTYDWLLHLMFYESKNNKKAKGDNMAIRELEMMSKILMQNAYRNCRSSKSWSFPWIFMIIVPKVKDCCIIPHQWAYEPKKKAAKRLIPWEREKEKGGGGGVSKLTKTIRFHSRSKEGVYHKCPTQVLLRLQYEHIRPFCVPWHQLRPLYLESILSSLST